MTAAKISTMSRPTPPSSPPLTPPPPRYPLPYPPPHANPPTPANSTTPPLSTTHLIVGAGEVGQALHAVLPYSVLRDVERVPVKPVILHIAYPYTADFVESVLADVDYHQPVFTVVHSTVPVGTCDPHFWVHSPVLGNHPDLKNALGTFRKHYGGMYANPVAEICAPAFKTVKTHPEASTTEAGKLWLLARYALEILVEKTIHASVNDFEGVYKDFAETYNDGYEKAFGFADSVNVSTHRLSVLNHKPGPLGGHCVARGARILTDVNLEGDDVVGLEALLKLLQTGLNDLKG